MPYCDKFFDVLSCETIRFWKYYVVPELYQKMYEKMAKNGFTRNDTISKLIKIFSSQFDTKILKPVTTFC